VPSPPPRSLPFRAGPYECHHYIGGNLAEVYIARDLRTGFNRAVKVLGSGYAPDSEFMQRFLTEGHAARLCTHPNIVTTYEADQSGGLAYIAMEHLQGETLKALLERSALRTMAERLNIALQVAQGLAYLHQRNIIHRDVKAENIHVDPAGHVKIFDFGVAKMNRQAITREGQLIGTPLYMSPEQVRGEQVTPASDMYSFGVVLFVLFCGAFPYHAVSREDLYAAIVFYAPDLTPLEGHEIPAAVTALIAQCLEKPPLSRPRSFREIELRLSPLVPQEVARSGTAEIGHAATAPLTLPFIVAAPARSLPPKSKPRAHWPLWLGAALVLLAAGGAVAFWLTNRPHPAVTARISTSTGFMMLVLAGPGFAGKDRHAVEVAGFYIDRAEASNETYRGFASATFHPLPESSQDLPATFPVVNVTYDDASAFCSWAGKRLPTDLEWEKAARGSKGLAYPWGDEPRPDLANIPGEGESRELEPVESNHAGASPYGAINLLGNVWEWVAKPESLEEDDIRGVVLNPPAGRGDRAFQIRGGSFKQHIDLSEGVWDFAVVPARLTRSDIGFRCARGL
jgi:formylglycine-generating enzyme required for sulfatase activity